jgi:hypothetical protein
MKLVKLISVCLIGLLSVVPLSASAVLIDFDDFVISNYASPNQDGDGLHTLQDAGFTFELTGNIWRSINLPYTVTASTILYFDYMSTILGEIQGIGFDVDDQLSTGFDQFQLLGTQSHGFNNFKNYTVGDGWVTYQIDVGSFFTGAYNTMYFANDKDNGDKVATSFFRNVEICEGCLRTSAVAVVPEPTLITLLALGMFGLSLSRYRRYKK